MIALHLFNIDIALNRSAGRFNRPVDVNHKNSRQDRSHVRNGMPGQFDVHDSRLFACGYTNNLLVIE